MNSSHLRDTNLFKLYKIGIYALKLLITLFLFIICGLLVLMFIIHPISFIIFLLIGIMILSLYAIAYSTINERDIFDDFKDL